MGESARRIGVLGGTLDPVHHGHLFAAEEVWARYGLDQVLFIPCGHAPHKDARGITAAEHRLEMCQLATATNPHFAVSRIEIDRPGPSYTIDTLRQLHGANGPGTELFFIIGADAVLELDTWHMPDAVLGAAQCVVVPRPGSSLTDLAGLIGEARAARLSVMDWPGLAISATDIRGRVREGRPIRYLTPDPVVEYILQRGLYRGQTHA